MNLNCRRFSLIVLFALVFEVLLSMLLCYYTTIPYLNVIDTKFAYRIWFVLIMIMFSDF